MGKPNEKPQKIRTDKAPAAVGPYSQAVISNGMVYCSGQIALSPETGEMVGENAEEQADQVLKNLTAVLEAAGSSLEKVVKVTVYLANMDDYASLNEVYGRYFNEIKPARAAIGVAALPKGALVEIECIAEI